MRAACGSERGELGSGEGATVNCERFGERAGAQDFHDWRASLMTADKPARKERCWRDRLARRKYGIKCAEIHDAYPDAVRCDRARAVLAVAATLREFLDKVAYLRADLVPCP